MEKIKNIYYLSSSQIKSFLECNYYFYQKYIRTPQKIKTKEKYVTLIDQDYFRLGKYRHKVLEVFMNNKHKNILNIAKNLLLKYNISLEEYIDSKKCFETFLKRPYIKHEMISTEKEYTIILSNGVALSATIDLLLKIDKNTILIDDFKTGGFKLTQQTLENSLQMKIYALIIKNIFPKYKNIIVQIDAINFDVFELKVTNKWLEGLEDYLEGIYQNIIEKKNEKDYVPKFCSICPICEYYKICPLMKNLNELKINPIIDLVDKNLNFLAEKYLEHSSCEKIAAKNKDIIKKLIVKLLQDIQSSEIEENWGIIKYTNNRLNIKLK
jgi:RecB family exonuclease